MKETLQYWKNLLMYDTMFGVINYIKTHLITLLVWKKYRTIKQICATIGAEKHMTDNTQARRQKKMPKVE